MPFIDILADDEARHMLKNSADDVKNDRLIDMDDMLYDLPDSVD